MAESIIMPKLGMDMTEATLLNWTKNVGDTIKPGDVIAEVETDKTAIEVESAVSGVILELRGNPGDTLKVGDAIGSVGAAGEQPAAAGGATAVRVDAAGAPAQSDVTAGSSRVANAPAGDAPAVQGAAGATAGQGVGRPVPATNGHSDGVPGGLRASPIARAIATERGIDLRQVRGSGPNGRITRSDVQNFTPPPAAAAPAGGGLGIRVPKLPEITGDMEAVDTPKMRRLIAERMVESKQQVPNFDVTIEVDVDALLNLRKQLNDGLPDEEKISVNDLIIKAVALTLRKFPNLNSHFYGDKIVRHKRFNIGIAVALPQGGLINVVAKDADKTALGAMAAHNKAMIQRARDGKLKPDDMSDSTFTVSNLGVYDVAHFKAIINPPEAGILAVGSAKKIPVVKPDGSIGVGNRMNVTLSVDHRVSDGAEGAQFLKALKDLIENPMRLLV